MAALTALLLHACATQRAPQEPTPSPGEALIEQADTALAQGKANQAAQLYAQAATQVPERQRAYWHLRAALVRLDQHREEAAQRLLEQTPALESKRARRLARLLRGGLQVTTAPGEARALLEPVPDGLDPRVAASWQRQLGRARLADGAPVAAAQAFSDGLGITAPRPAQFTALRQALQAIPLPRLRQLVPADPDRFGAWLELAYAVRDKRLQPAAMRQAVADWRQRYPKHPAAQGFAEQWLDQAIASLRPPPRVAVLLPLTGSLASVGQAVERGFLTAYYGLPAGERPDLYIYDIGASGVSSLTAYRQALAAEASLVIGPLTKPALEQLTARDAYPIPVLALNRLSDPAAGADGLYQFGLAPEDDAAAAAALAVALGHRRVGALLPYNEWGERVGDSFRRALRRRDGSMADVQSYDPDAKDFSEPIRELFQLQRSTQRHQNLQRTLKRQLAFEPKPRGDMEAVFIGAYPTEARLLKPQIRFHQGVGLPVIATSQAYSGRPAPQADQDMNGLHLVVMPWLLEADLGGAIAAQKSRLKRHWGNTLARYPRLVALGLDAGRLMGPLDVLAAEPSYSMPGATGEIMVDERGVVHRGLRPAQFRNGRLIADPSPPQVLGRGASAP